ncbi:bifunctional 3,4-dihydroxy-2-butanone 4-phosphate synthase/GTP cyclohydrolase II [Helicobacter ailurogastricus]|uniref:3,4-dihydroxy-2-butanone 4-phosphate synthase n=1 Tax=Helicobacter ailurogastricus TaxID=1578720 RepID=A0A0K2X7L9_9HELI|nr:bifunctional 3,4-dihydroxy-2-butanone 4-phosphate synthase/GTP cyclohydrolase II [Helicobacter ailurogastricus]CRF40704.1 3,4-dihydroxy-2-butanone 4-phosphate synthase / GTP cyclohydrolase II [Helicobacter ailurogastricus]CRF43097.1 3,4-dihydroxy-2-butanone 4-phosphate synthase / GTP cyclohydrolase II [Helicobacter ailurogastricus]CRF44326.1 3,4-dihydroxy-2-butanone 4-phosphate synthase / GTP cyclohydrolase II [Helicobacter ailurogastricus]GLH57405.1 Bifunctional 3,4-dihydroxy-2-butanone 4-p
MTNLKRVEEAIKALKNGELVILMDDEDRENEGDLVMAGIFTTPEKINFMAKHARGLICVALTQEIASKFELKPMVSHNDSKHETAFTISIDARAAKTGISAYERSLTIELLCKEHSTPEDFVRPGHIFPLIAKEEGVLVRTGHTEASVDLCKLAGLKPVSVICEIMKEDGSMAKRGDKFLLDFAKTHDLKVLYVSDIVSYRLQSENLLRLLEESPAQLAGVHCHSLVFLDHLKRKHFVYRFADLGNAPLVRFHIIRSDHELLSHAQNYNFFMRVVERLRLEGGVLVFIDPQAKVHDTLKNFGIGALVLKSLGIKTFRLLTTQDSPEYTALKGFDLEMLEAICP